MVRKKMCFFVLKYHFLKWVTYWVFSQWANQPEMACLYLILSISSSVSWFSVLSLSSDSLSVVLRFEPLTLSLTHPRTYTHMLPLTFTKRKIHQLDSWSFLFLASFWSYMSLCISTKLSHTFTHTFLKKGAVSTSCPFWQHGSLMLFTHNTQTPVHVCFDRSALRHWQGLPWGTAQKSVSNPDSSQTHEHTDGRVIGAGLGLCSQDADLPHSREQFALCPLTDKHHAIKNPTVVIAPVTDQCLGRIWKISFWMQVWLVTAEYLMAF